MDRPGLAALLDYARQGDTLAVVRLDRLGRSLAELLTTVAMLKKRDIPLLSGLETTPLSRAAISTVSGKYLKRFGSAWP